MIIRCLCLSLAVSGAALAQPDLQIQGLSVYSTTLQSDGNRLVSVSFRVVNGGSAAAAPSVTRIELNGNAGVLATPRLQPGQIAFLSHFVRTTANPVNIAITADAQQQVAERDEGNNALQYTADTVGVEDGRWQSLGPSVVRDDNGSARGVGRVTTLAVDPRTADTVYVGARGSGIWKTTSGGATWFPIGDALPTANIAAIAVDPVHPNRVLMASTTGIFESADGGAVWTQITNRNLFPRGHDGAAFLIQPVPDPVIAPLAAAAATGGVLRPEPALYLSTDNGLQVSTDGGRNWTLVVGGGAVGSLQFNTGDPSHLLMAINTVGIFEGENGGIETASWRRIRGCPTAPLPPIPAHARVWFGETGVQRWMSFLDTSAKEVALFKSKSRACTVNGRFEFEWEKVPIDSSCNAELKDNSSFLFLHPKNARIVFKGGRFLCRNDQGGAPKKIAQSDLHVDQHAIAIAPSQPSTMYLGNDGGLYRSDDNGATWRFVSEGLGVAEYLDGTTTANGIQVVGTAWDNGASSGNSVSPVFASIGGGDATSAAFDRADESILYFIGDQSIRKILRRSGGSSKNISDSSVLPDCVTGTESGPTVMGQIASTGSSKPPLVVACDDGGSSGLFAGPPWKRIAAGNFGRVKVGPGGFMLAGASDGRVFGGRDFSAPALLMPARTASQISGLGFGGAGVFYASNSSGGLQGRVFRLSCTTDTQCTSEDITGNLPSGQVMTIAGDPLAPDSVLAALRNGGVFRGVRAGGSVNWQSFSNGLPGRVTVTDLEASTSGQIIAATFGRGVFRLHSGTPRSSTQSASGIITSFEEERVDPEKPPGPSNPVIMTMTLDSQPGTTFTGEALSGTARTQLRNAFNNHRSVSITFLRTSATSARILRVLP